MYCFLMSSRSFALLSVIDFNEEQPKLIEYTVLINISPSSSLTPKATKTSKPKSKTCSTSYTQKTVNGPPPSYLPFC